jgi:hypothetical protein
MECSSRCAPRSYRLSPNPSWPRAQRELLDRRIEPERATVYPAGPVSPRYPVVAGTFRALPAIGFEVLAIRAGLRHVAGMLRRVAVLLDGNGGAIGFHFGQRRSWPRNISSAVIYAQPRGIVRCGDFTPLPVLGNVGGSPGSGWYPPLVLPCGAGVTVTMSPTAEAVDPSGIWKWT